MSSFFDGTNHPWHYHLNTRQYSASGTYTVFMKSGDGSEYLVEPTCTGQFAVK